MLGPAVVDRLGVVDIKAWKFYLSGLLAKILDGKWKTEKLPLGNRLDDVLLVLGGKFAC